MLTTRLHLEPRLKTGRPTTVFSIYTDMTGRGQVYLCVISGFRRKAAENCAVLGYFHNQWILNPEDRTVRLSQNDGKELPLLAA